MKRLVTFDYADPHDVVLVYRPLTWRARRKMDQVCAVLIDGTPICLPKGSTVKVEADVGGAGQQVTITILAASVDAGRWKEPTRG